VVGPQKAQQERRPARPTWEKAQKYCNKGNMPLEEALLLERRWITEKTVATYVECGECEGKGVQTHKNWRQRFLFKRQVKNM